MNKAQIIEILREFGHQKVSACDNQCGYPDEEEFATRIDSLYSTPEISEELWEKYRNPLPKQGMSKEGFKAALKELNK